MEQKTFKTDVSDLLHLIIHSLYSHKEIFLRELVSNASDALDKRRLKILLGEAKGDDELKIELSFDNGEQKKLIISDNGIGMSHDELVTNLGTIAHSGTKEFLSKLSGDNKKDSALIGQFGVGFYSVFMVSDKVEVISRSYLSDEAYKWSSTGRDKFSIDKSERDGCGTDIVIYLNDEGAEFANRWRLDELVKQYSDSIVYPIYLTYTVTKTDEKDKDKKTEETKRDKINTAVALWRKNKAELKDSDYNDFYKANWYDSEEPLLHIHTKAEGTVEYNTLFFIPKTAPYDIKHPDYKCGLKLYVKRVFITDDNRDILPNCLRFVRGIIDCDDLPLNVSREILQHNTVMNTIKNSATKKIYSELKKLSKDNPELFDSFVSVYNSILKEGLYQDYFNHDDLLEIIRFRSTESDGYVSLADYKSRMKEGQKNIFYLVGSSVDILKDSPLIGSYKEKGFEVLLMADPIDEFIVGSIGSYAECELKAINRVDAEGDLGETKAKTDDEKKENEKNVEKIKKALGDKVGKVIFSSRLKNVCAQVLVDESGMTYKIREVMKAMGTGMNEKFVPDFELNENDPFVKKIIASEDEDFIRNSCELVFDEALIREGILPADIPEFSKNFHKMLESSL